ncbi:MAG: ABC transporter ATP-binding protein [Clostridia bacterium]|jgi:energy-coupling factor transporter ATP-binding protein EcfA2|nr:energy-coupling factor ABC transporter ATP-binding protein [Clostridia bacterium]MDD4276016.1 ABC transporter ATP-binding protein [Clostridia bacterium]
MTLQLQVENLNFNYKEDTKFSLKNINFCVDSGEIICITGKIGSGKSTLLYALKGILKFNGKAYLNYEHEKIENLKNNSGLLMQYAEDQLFGNIVKEDIGFALTNLKLSTEEKVLKIKNAMESVGLDYIKYADQNVYSLSGGERRLVALAGAIILQPKVLFLDEPFIMLDRIVADKIMKMIKNYTMHNNAIVIVATHDNSYAHMFTKTLVLNNGEQTYFGDTDKLYSDKKKFKLLNIEMPDIYKVLNNCKQAGIVVNKPYSLSNIAKQIAEAKL